MKTRDFVKISPTFWTGPTGRQLRKAGAEVQLVALYLMSSPHTNYSGLFQLPLNYIANDTGLSLEAVRKALSAIAAVGFARYDENSECAWIVEGAKWQLGELKAVDKRVMGLQKEFDSLPEDCPYKVEFLAKHGKALCLSSSKSAKQYQATKQAELVPAPKPATATAKAPPAQDTWEVTFFKNLDELMQRRARHEMDGDSAVHKAWLEAAGHLGYEEAARGLRKSLSAGDLDEYAVSMHTPHDDI